MVAKSRTCLGSLGFLGCAILVFFLVGCGQSKEELLAQGDKHSAEGNHRGAVVLYKNALEKDANFLPARIGLANAYLEVGSFAKAENEYRKVLHQNPAAIELKLKLARVYIGQKNPEAAFLSLDEYLASGPETSEVNTLYGIAYGVAGDLKSAESFFKKANQLDPNFIPPRLYLAKILLQRKNYEGARQFLSAIIAQDSGMVEAYYILANLETSSGDLDEAITIYQDLVTKHPQQLKALYLLGLLQLDKGDIDQAQKAADQLNKEFKDRGEGQRLEGLLLYRQEKFNEAILSLDSSNRQQPHPLSSFFIGLCQFRLNHLELALNAFQRALDLNPKFERARILVALTLLKQQRVDDAIQVIQRVLEENEESGYAHNILGSAYLIKGRMDDGMAELEKATELEPGLAEAHLKRGIFHLSAGDDVQGEEDLLKAVAAAPEVLNSRLMLVSHFLKQKNFSDAIETLQAGMDGSPADALLYNYLAAAYFSQKKADLALASLKKAKQADPGYLKPYFNLASYFAVTRDYQRALEEYRSVLEIEPKNLKAMLGMAALYNLQGLTAQQENIYRQLEVSGDEKGIVAAATYQMRQGEDAEAIRIVESGLGIFKSSPALLELQGGLNLRLKDYDKAESSFTRLSGVSPERGNQLLLRFYLLTGRLDQAEKLSSELLRNAPEEDYAYLLAADLAIGKKRPDSAVEVLQEGLSGVRNPVRLRMRLAALYQADGNLQKATRIYQEIIKNDLNFAPAYVALGAICESQGEKGKAQEYYRTALQYDDNNGAALNNLAFLLTDNFGQEEEALGFAMRAYRIFPNDPRVMDTLGYVLLKNRRPVDAIKLLGRALELLPQVYAVKLHLAMAQLGDGQVENARKLLDQVVANGSDSEVRQAKTLLDKI